MKLRLGGLFTAAVFVAGVGTVFGFFSRFAWFFDLASHFRVQYFAAFLSLAVALCIARRWRLAMFAAGMMLINAVPVASLYLPGPVPREASSKVYRAMLINVNTKFGNPDAVKEAIESFDPDFLVVEEVNEQWMADLQPVLEGYKHRAIRARDDNFGIGFLSRYAWTESQVLYGDGVALPSICARFKLEDQDFAVIASHPVPPSGARNSAYRNGQLEWLADLAQHFDGALLLVGDLNVSPFSFHFRRLLQKGGLRDSSQGCGFQPTWPAIAFPFLIPIDHMLHSDELIIRSKSIGPDVGSDHYPVLLEFSLAAP